ncbi:MAG TPA: chemotaxis protein CheC [Opitutaceae bacterium]|nr:chemotaxis protein CheC [Opitutaceae bacterium]
MELSPPQTDALTELINIGYGRAAGALSELTGYRVSLEVPRIGMHRIEEIPPLLAEMVRSDVATVTQVFSGPLAGTAMLILDEKAAMVLSRLLSDEKNNPGGFDANGREIISEVGNILLNACLGVFGNLLQVQVTFAMPQLQVSAAGRVLESVSIEREELQYGLMVHTRFQVRASNVTGFLVIVLGITSLDRLLHELDNWEHRQTSP